MNEHDSNSLTKLERLAVLMREHTIEPESMNPQQLAEYLEELKVDMADPRKRFEFALKKAKAQQRLEQAHERRLKAVDKAKTLLCSGNDAIESAKAKIAGMIQNLAQRNPDQAQIYAREFEKATPEDLAALQEDLTLLEMESQEDDKGNS